MTSVTRSQVPIHLGLDGSKNTISVGMLEPRADTAVVSRNAADDDAMRRLMNKFPDRSRLRVCYEAGLTGFRLARILACWGIDCEVIAPPRLPRESGNRIKTDRRGAASPAGLHRAALPVERAPRRLACQLTGACRLTVEGSA